MKAEEQNYLRLNGKYLSEAEDLIERQDFAQASEKLWGAAADRSSRTTVCPSLAREETNAEPMSPEDPVTRYFMTPPTCRGV